MNMATHTSSSVYALAGEGIRNRGGGGGGWESGGGKEWGARGAGASKWRLVEIFALTDRPGRKVGKEVVCGRQRTRWSNEN